jgi:hypothetical protein
MHTPFLLFPVVTARRARTNPGRCRTKGSGEYSASTLAKSTGKCHPLTCRLSGDAVLTGHWLICLGLVSGAGAGLLAGLLGIGGGIVVVPAATAAMMLRASLQAP